MGGRGGSSGISAGGTVRGDVSFAEIVKASPNSISFGKTVTVMPDGKMPQSGRKSDLGDLISKNNIKDVTVHMYRDRSGANDLQRMKDLGFEIVAQYKGKSTSSSIPPVDYYYMKKRKK